MKTDHGKDAWDIGPPLRQYRDTEYYADTYGNVFSAKFGKIRKLKQSKVSKGYLAVNICRGDGKPKRTTVHHIVAEVFHGPRPEGMHVLHGPAGKLVNTPANLRYGTPAENEADKLRDGTDCSGEKHGQAKLTWDQVRQIRAEYQVEVKGIKVRRDLGLPSQEDLAVKFGVYRTIIEKIVNGKLWKE